MRGAMCVYIFIARWEWGPVDILDQISKIHLHSSLPWRPSSSDSSQAHHWMQEPTEVHDETIQELKHFTTDIKRTSRKLLLLTWVLTMSSYPMLISATSTFIKIQLECIQQEWGKWEREREREYLWNHNKLFIWWLWHWMQQLIQKLDWSFIFVLLSILQIWAARSKNCMTPCKILQVQHDHDKFVHKLK